MSTLLAEHGWVYEVFAVVFLALIAAYVQKRILARVHRRLERTKTPWDDAFIGALQRPLGVLIWIVGIAFAAELVQRQVLVEAAALEELGARRLGQAEECVDGRSG